MILTGEQIKWAKQHGYLDIDPWDDKRLNPNSYNLRLADEIATYFTVPITYKEWGDLEPCRQKYYKEKYESDPRYREYFDSIVDKTGEFPKFPDRFGLDMKQDMKLITHKIPPEGFILEPGVLYLGRTMERTETHKFVPMLEGRSSGGRLGISIHETAGFGDIGFCGYWTLEITCAQPIRIYAGVDICQIYYHMVCDNDDLMRMCLNTTVRMKYDKGKYQNNTGIQPSMLWKEFS